MSNPPDDIAAAREDWLFVTGLAGNALGIAADDRHLSNGGYHCGSLDLKSINGISRDDYSIRQPRDRQYYYWEVAHGSNFASATDIGKTWARGGTAAWLRFCALLRLQLGARDPLLSAVRGINYTNAAGAVRRFDCLTHTESSSTDKDHTHIEFWRDTVMTAERGRALSRITQIMVAARDQTPLGSEAGSMAEFTEQQVKDIAYTLGVTPDGPGPIHARITVMMSQLSTLVAAAGQPFPVDAVAPALAQAVAERLANDETLPHITTADVQQIADVTAATFAEHLRAAPAS